NPNCFPADTLLRPQHETMNNRSEENNGRARNDRRNRADHADSEQSNRQKPPEEFHLKKQATRASQHPLVATIKKNGEKRTKKFCSVPYDTTGASPRCMNFLILPVPFLYCKLPAES